MFRIKPPGFQQIDIADTMAPKSDQHLRDRLYQDITPSPTIMAMSSSLTHPNGPVWSTAVPNSFLRTQHSHFNQTDPCLGIPPPPVL